MWVACCIIKKHGEKEIDDAVCGLHTASSNNMEGIKQMMQCVGCTLLMNRLHVWHLKTQFFDQAHTASDHATYLQSYGRHATDLEAQHHSQAPKHNVSVAIKVLCLKSHPRHLLSEKAHLLGHPTNTWLSIAPLQSHLPSQRQPINLLSDSVLCRAVFRCYSIPTLAQG